MNVNRAILARSRQSSLAGLTTPGSRAQDFGADRCRRSARRTGLQGRRECLGRCSIERSTLVAGDGEQLVGAGSRHRGRALFDDRQEASAGRAYGEVGVLASGLQCQHGASRTEVCANFWR